MSFSIDPNINDGLPFISVHHLELSQDTTRIIEPYPEGFFHLKSDVNGGIPYITESAIELAADKSTIVAPYPDSFFRKTSDVNDGVPYISEIHVVLGEDSTMVVAPYPQSFFRKLIDLNDGIPYINEEAIKLAEDPRYVNEPYPDSFFHLDVSKTDPINNSVPFISEEAIKLSEDPRYVNEPYPDSFFQKSAYNNGTPYITDRELINGAFIHAIDVEYVYIPYQVTKFGKYAFMDTPKLSEVEINALSTYEETTFDENTLIKYYNIRTRSFSMSWDDLTEDDILSDMMDSGSQVYTEFVEDGGDLNG